MEIDGLDYNTQRERLKLMAYGRDIQQMVDYCVALPEKAERQKCANTVIEVMKKVVPSQMDDKERMPALWYHLALMSDFKLDIDYPVEIVHENKMAQKPGKIEYTSKKYMNAKHYGRLIFAMFDKLKSMPDGEERDALTEKTIVQMYRCLSAWGMGTADKERIISDIARYTDGVIQLDTDDIDVESLMRYSTNGKGRPVTDNVNCRKKKRRKK